MPGYQKISGNVVKTQMMMEVLLDDGRRVRIPGNAPSGSDIDMWCTDITTTRILGYDGYEIKRKPARFAGTADQLARVEQLEWVS